MSAIEKQKHGYSLRFRPLGKQVRVQVPVETEEQVVKTKVAVEMACRSGQFSGLSDLEKETAAKLGLTEEAYLKAKTGK